MRRPGPLAWAVVAALATFAARFAPAVTEAWGRHVYPALTHVVVPVTELGSWPWTPGLAVAGVVTTALWAHHAASLGRAAARVATVALLIAVAFEGAWGLHQARPGVEVRLALADAPPGDAWAEPLARRLEAILRRDAPTGPFAEADAVASTRAEVAAFAPGVRLPSELDVAPPWLLGPWGVGGVVSPWTLEAHVDGGLPAWARASVGAHELAHLAGFAGEADAELVGLIAGLRADAPDARYAAALRAWASLPASLRRPEEVPPRALDDLEALRASAGRVRTAWAGAAWRAYDAWLRARGQAEGVAGYGRGPHLLARAAATDLW